jgi:hypothetical protein
MTGEANLWPLRELGESLLSLGLDIERLPGSSGRFSVAVRVNGIDHEVEVTALELVELVELLLLGI